MDALKRFLADESGPTAVEYAVMLMLIFSACIGVIQFLGNSLGGNLQDSADAIDAAM